MSLHKINPTETKAWKKLIDQKHNLSTETLNSLFSKESNRLNYLSIKWDCFDVDEMCQCFFYVAERHPTV